ncbi:MAG: hypothetical protein RIR00_2481 [Pseudomonadota bacterium]|jgi:hypothetical protein
MSALFLASSLNSRSLFPSAWRQQSASATGGSKTSSETGATSDLSDAQQREVTALQQTDRRVRQHEQMHMAVGAGLVVSGPTYSFKTGPDGRRYAVAGEVSIDTSKGRTPEETLVKATTVRAAALAPPDPSAQDRRAAAMAERMAAEARLELATRQSGTGDAETQPEAIRFYRSMSAGGTGGDGQRVSAFA